MKNLIPGRVLLLVMLAILCATTGCHSLPMTNEDLDLVALGSVEEEPKEQTGPVESQFVGRIAPRKEIGGEEQPEQFETFVRELEAAGVRTAERRDLRTLSYKELTRLLALWHLSQGRNYYEAAADAEEEEKEEEKKPSAVYHHK
ncbi:uncharacterized protein [Drosophila bipectinata]|uniref:uncharacterized protein n=1 Tax=Drosophila bipectinata TaxID=42026 RepID=UPI001C8A163C|nr:uncharacterized protein LOC108133621 [Drosophila bipectinata]